MLHAVHRVQQLGRPAMHHALARLRRRSHVRPVARTLGVAVAQSRGSAGRARVVAEDGRAQRGLRVFPQCPTDAHLRRTRTFARSRGPCCSVPAALTASLAIPTYAQSALGPFPFMRDHREAVPRCALQHQIEPCEPSRVWLRVLERRCVAAFDGTCGREAFRPDGLVHAHPSSRSRCM